MVVNNTSKSFDDKWHRNKSLAFANTLNEDSEIFRWILERNGFKGADDLRTFLKEKTRILDAGCGNGRVTALLREHSDPATTAVMGIDLVAANVAAENLKEYSNVSFAGANLLDDLSALGKFDFIYCQEVLHHTGNAAKGFDNLVRLLAKDGEIAIYVYKQKAPVREFVDDYVRERIAGMKYEEAMEHCRQITELGKALSAQKVTLKVPGVTVLGIEEGEYDLQRFLYHFFVKCFWNDEFNPEDNAVINYDWYHPQDCTRHTIEEVRGWFVKNGLEINQECVDHYGITVRGKLV